MAQHVARTGPAAREAGPAAPGNTPRTFAETDPFAFPAGLEAGMIHWPSAPPVPDLRCSPRPPANISARIVPVSAAAPPPTSAPPSPPLLQQRALAAGPDPSAPSVASPPPAARAHIPYVAPGQPGASAVSTPPSPPAQAGGPAARDVLRLAVPEVRSPATTATAPVPPPPPGEANRDAASNAARPSPWRRAAHLLRSVLRWLMLAVAAYFVLALLAIGVFRFIDPPGSMLMLQRAAFGETITHSWVPLDSISPNLARAVIVSEDGRFCQHWGIDFGELKAAIERAKDGMPRGASTITMQLAKNLLLVPAKSYVRKAAELPLTLAIEATWPKRRILEVYLNIAEWGPGIFGAQAAAWHHFGKPARRLTDAEAALLAVSLPNPFDRDASDPGPGTERLAHRIQARMQAASRATSCLGR